MVEPWISPSVQLPYLVMVGIICLGIVAFCIYFCIDIIKEEYEHDPDGCCRKRKRKKGRKEKIPDVEMDTFPRPSTPPDSTKSFSLEAALNGSDDGIMKTPLVLRGFSGSREDQERDQDRRNIKAKSTSGSSGEQSSWSYVNLGFEKDVDLILSPDTVKRKGTEAEDKNEKSTAEKEMEETSSDLGYSTLGESMRGEQEGTAAKGGAEDTERESEAKNYIELETFGHVRGGGDDGENSLRRKKRWITSNDWRRGGELSEKDEAEKKTENEPPGDVGDEEEGFRLKYLTKEWDANVWRRGTTGETGRDEVDNEEGKPVNEPPIDYRGEEEKPPPRPRRFPGILSQFTASTKLLLPHEEVEEEEEEEEEEVRREEDSQDRGYTATLTQEHKEGWKEGQIRFYDDGRRRDFKYFSA